MIVEVSKINPDGDDLCGAVPATVLEMEQDSVFRVESPIDCRFHVQLVSHELIVRGELAVTVSFACSKCAENVSTTLRDLSFLRAYPIPKGRIRLIFRPTSAKIFY
jgi:hypothetical protein